jgi:hypothetical protein
MGCASVLPPCTHNSLRPQPIGVEACASSRRSTQSQFRSAKTAQSTGSFAPGPCRRLLYRLPGVGNRLESAARCSFSVGPTMCRAEVALLSSQAETALRKSFVRRSGG